MFGIETDDGSVITPSEYFKTNYIIALDLPCAFAYFFFMYEVMLMACYLFANDKLTLRRFSWTFLVTNLLGVTTFYFYPAAPPWYAIEYGMGPAKLDIPPNPARLSAVDTYLGINYFEAIYSHSTNLFASIPSLQAAYPLIVWFTAFKVFPRYHLFFFALALLTGFAAVYLCHHYVIDVILGFIYASIA